MVEPKTAKNKQSSCEDSDEASEEFRCSICWMTLFQPVTTECGHTFCKACLQKTLQIRRECTLCKTKIYQSSTSNLQINFILQAIIQKKYPKYTAKRQNEFEKEEKLKNERQKVIEGQLVVIKSKANVFKNMQT